MPNPPQGVRNLKAMDWCEISLPRVGIEMTRGRLPGRQERELDFSAKGRKKRTVCRK
jgi:hypothetical protein